VPSWGVHLRRAKPRQLDAYREAFSGVTPRFGRPYNEMWFPRAALELPVQGADPELSAILEGHAELLTELVPREDPFIERVRAALVAALERGRIDIEGVARAVAISERSLRRQLCARQTTYRQLVDEARRELACKLLVEREPVQAVADRVGFRSVSAFQKAFQRWMKVSPSEYRRVATREEVVSSPMHATDGMALRSPISRTARAHLR
jgi:AraC-like DNA-binding protein